VPIDLAYTIVNGESIEITGGGAGEGQRGQLPAPSPTCRQGEGRQTVSNAPSHFADLME